MFKVGELVKIELVGNNFQKEMALIVGLTFRGFFVCFIFSAVIASSCSSREEF